VVHREGGKSGTRYKGGEPAKRIYIRSWDQKMVKGKDWQSFFNSIENKNNLINITGSFLRHETGRQKVTGNVVFTQSEKIWKIAKNDAVEVLECNHEEADTRMVLHACLDDTNVVVVSRDTDVFVLLVHAFSIVKPTSQWFMEIDHQKYVDIGKACSYLGEEVSLRLPQFHAITGCNTTSFFFGVGKVKVLKKLIKDSSKYALLDSIGKTSSLTENAHAETLKFIQTVLYRGKEEETLVQTRIRLYQAMKTKSSQSLPPDPDSARQAILRIHYQVNYWLRYAVKMVPAIPFADNGWKIDENGVSPVWFTGTYTQICSLFRPFWSLCPKSHCKRMFLSIFHLRQPVSAFPDKKR